MVVKGIQSCKMEMKSKVVMFLFFVVAALLLSAVIGILVWRFGAEHHHGMKNPVNITILHEAALSDAVCLDGSPPAYHFQPGNGSGIQNWVLYWQGGGWCNDEASCLNRTTTCFGSSNHMPKQQDFRGIMSNSITDNPDFYNWNRVWIDYCDGASFIGDSDIPLQNGKILKSKGRKIFQYMVSYFLQRGMDSAEKILFTGSSAGGLSTIHNCDYFRTLIPNTIKTKCVSDAGYFSDVQDLSGNYSFRSIFSEVVTLHNVSQFLPENCTKNHKELCFFPQYVVEYIETPMFFINTAFDFWQVQNIIIPDQVDPYLKWFNCKWLGICNHQQVTTLNQDLRLKMIEALSYTQTRKDWGLFINSCFHHCQEITLWNMVEVNSKTVQQAVGDWFLERTTETKLMDNCPYPCNSKCGPFSDD